jgi:hypothetical protein
MHAARPANLRLSRRGDSVCLSVCLSVQAACRTDRHWTIPESSVNLSTLLLYHPRLESQARRRTNSAEFGFAFHVGKQDDDCRPLATTRLAAARAAADPLLPSDVAKNPVAHLRLGSFAQFSICPPEIKLRNPISSSLIAHYSSLCLLPYLAPQAIP